MDPNTIILIVAGVAAAIWLWQAAPVAWAWAKSRFAKAPTPPPPAPAEVTLASLVAARDVLRPFIPPETDAAVWKALGDWKPASKEGRP